jgi:hypothetical protein
VEPGSHVFLAEAAGLPPAPRGLLGLLTPLGGQMSRPFNWTPAVCHVLTVYETQQTRELRVLSARLHRGPEQLS